MLHEYVISTTITNCRVLTVYAIYIFVIFLDFHSTKQGQPLADSWSRGLD